MITRNEIETEFRKHLNLKNNYFKSWKQSVLPNIEKNMFWDEMNNGDGSELKGVKPKFNSVVSSSALTVNSFAIWKKENYIENLNINGFSNFTSLEFECKFANGLKGNSPNLDVVLNSKTKLLV